MLLDGADRGAIQQTRKARSGWLFGSSLNTLDPAKTKIGEEYIQNFLIYSGVTEIDRDGKLKPDLAESWTASDDVKTWTFKIRKGVKFHHGREADAEDVKATIERVIDKATGSVARVNFEIIDTMEVLDSHTIKFTLKSPYAGLPRSSATARLASSRATSWTRSARSRSEPAPSSSSPTGRATGSSW